MVYTHKGYEILFDANYSATENIYEDLRHRDVYRYRMKTIRSGPYIECEIYPLWNTRNEARTAKARMTPEAQRNLNHRNSVKRMIRLINTNFGAGDLCLDLTYKGQPPNEEQARRDVRNYLRRIRDHRRKNALPALKYVYVMEFGTEGRRKRIHHHVIMSAMDRNAAETLWGKGRANSDRLQPDEYGLEAKARYLAKESREGKRWAASRNLAEPRITTADTRISRREVERMAADLKETPAILLTRKFPAHTFTDCEIRRSKHVAGAYIYARMRMEPSPPKHKEGKRHGKRAKGGP